MLAGKRVVVFIDNTAALNTTIKGWSRRQDANAFVHQVWLVSARAGIDAQWEYVPSKLNIAGSPSRGKLQVVHELGVERCEVQWPADL